MMGTWPNHHRSIQLRNGFEGEIHIDQVICRINLPRCSPVKSLFMVSGAFSSPCSVRDRDDFGTLDR